MNKGHTKTLAEQRLNFFKNGREGENWADFQRRMKHVEMCRVCKKVFDTKVFHNCPRCR